MCWSSISLIEGKRTSKKYYNFNRDYVIYFSFQNDLRNEEIYKEITLFVHLFVDQLCSYKASQNVLFYFKLSLNAKRN